MTHLKMLEAFIWSQPHPVPRMGQTLCRHEGLTAPASIQKGVFLKAAGKCVKK